MKRITKSLFSSFLSVTMLFSNGFIVSAEDPAETPVEQTEPSEAAVQETAAEETAEEIITEGSEPETSGDEPEETAEEEAVLPAETEELPEESPSSDPADIPEEAEISEEEPAEVYAETTDFTYELSDDGSSAVITGYTGSDTDLIIPDTIDGYPVSAIGEWSFSRKSMQTVAVPEGVTEIQDGAFTSCENMKSISLPSTLRKLSGEVFNSCTSLESLVIPEGVTEIGSGIFERCSSLSTISFPSTLTTIGGGAFISCASLKNITIPASVTSIGDNAFYEIEGLESVTVEEGNTAYTSINGALYTKDLSVLMRVPNNAAEFTVDEHTTTIGKAAFMNCHDLTSVVLPEGLIVIENYAFQYCSKLTSITFPSTLESILFAAFYKCTGLESIVLPDHLKTIESNQFVGTGCRLTSITIPKGITTWGFYDADSDYMSSPFGETGDFDNYANLTVYFKGTEKEFADLKDRYLYSAKEIIFGEEDPEYQPSADLTYTVTDGTAAVTGYTGNAVSVEVPAEYDGNPVTSIADNAFADQYSIRSLTLPSTIRSIGEYAFKGCYGLQSIVIPEGTAEIGKRAFENCTGLRSVTLPSTLEILGKDSDGNNESWVFYNCSSLQSIEIPEGITEIYDGTFLQCGHLTSVTLPSTLKKIGNEAFSNCYQLESIVIPEGTEEIGSTVFERCESLSSITLPSTLTSIGNYVFDQCISLEYLTIPASVTSIGTAPFAEKSAIKAITVEEGNTAYTSIDGALYTKDLSRLIMVPVDVTEFTAADDTKVVCDSALTSCSELVSVILPEGAVEIERDAFQNCTKMTSIKLPSTLETIGFHAFMSCRSLKSIRLPDGLKSIDSQQFIHCDDLTRVVVPKGITTWGYHDEDGGDYMSSPFGDSDSLCPNMSNLTVCFTGTEEELAAYKDPYIYQAKEIIYNYDDSIESFDIEEAVLNRGKTYDLLEHLEYSDTQLTWSSSDNTVASVNENGTVEGLKPGTADITVRSSTGKELTVKVQVNAPITSIRLDQTELTLTKGSSKTLTAVLEPADTTDDKTIIWTSTDNEVASVTSDGTVTAVGAGTAVISAEASNGMKAEASVTVTVPVESIVIEPKIAGVKTGSTISLTAAVLPEDTTEDKTVSWSSDREDIAAVDVEGNVTGLSMGTAVITAETASGIKAQATVVVAAEETSVTVENTEDLAEEVRNTESDAQILVSYTDESAELDSSVLDEIKDTDRTLILQNDGVEWVFSGKDIVNEIKTIDLSVQAETFIDAADVQEDLENRSAVVLTFADNGELPGKATVRLKLDDEQIGLLGISRLTVYYYDEQADTITLIASDLEVIHDEYIEFEISHCSKYVIAAEASDFVFEKTDDGTGLKLTGYTGTDKHVVIPDTIKGYPVTELGGSVFAGHSGLRTVSIPAGTAKLNEHLFKDCTELTGIYYAGTQEEWNALTENIELDIDPAGTSVYVSRRMHHGSVMAVVDMIEHIRTVTLDDEETVRSVREAYDALSEEEKAETDNYQILENAEKTIEELKQQEAADHAAAEAVTAMIHDLPAAADLKAEDEEAVKKVRAAYDALTDKQKALVSDYQTLIDLEEKLEELLNVSGKVWVKHVKHQLVKDYTGSAVKLTDYEVYYGTQLLKEGTDYKVSYTGNKNAGTAQMIIALKGSYAKFYEGKTIIEFTIRPVNLETDERITADDITAKFTNKNQTAKPAVYFNGKKLPAKKNYQVTQPVMNAPGSYQVSITGFGPNFTGTKEITYTIISPENSALMSKASVKIPAVAVQSTSEDLKHLFEEGRAVVKDGKKTLTYGEDYTVECDDLFDTAGTGYALIKGTEKISSATGKAYYGEKRITFKVTGTKITSAMAALEYASAEYTGSALTPKVTMNGLTEDDFDVKYSNNTNAGTASVLITGKGSYTGTVKKTFRITKADVSKVLEVSCPQTAEYAAGGSKPAVTVSDIRTGQILKEGIDYKLSYSNNKAVTLSSKQKAPAVKVTGLGNYGKSLTVSFVIVKADISGMTISAPDTAYVNKKGNWKTALKVLDENGKVLSAKNDYTAEYTCGDDVLTASSIVKEGDVITVKVTGKGKYDETTSISAQYRVAAGSDVKNISSAKVTVSPAEYTGSALTPEVTVQAKDGTVLVKGTDYEIACYAGNTDPGKNALVIIKGIGNWSGTKTQKFTIRKASDGTWWSNVINALPF